MAAETDEEMPVIKHSIHTLVFRSLKRTHDFFLSEQGKPIPEDEAALKMKIACKVNSEHAIVKNMPPPNETVAKITTKSVPKRPSNSSTNEVPMEVTTGHPYPNAPGVLLTPETAAVHRPLSKEGIQSVVEDIASKKRDVSYGASVSDIHSGTLGSSSQAVVLSHGTKQLVPRRAPISIKPQWHPPWKLMRVISGHLGWVRCISVDPGNEWFATGSGDRTIKLWELASGKLKLTLTGHISSVRGLGVSHRQPYLFSCGEDKLVKCWDLEQNKVIRHYHGHLSGVYCLSIHPTIDVLVTAGRDCTARIWDMRTKACVHTLTGHTNTIADLFSQGADPQVVTGSHDSTIRFWDLAAGKTSCVLTHHKKSVRALANHPSEFTFASASPDNIKQWKFPDGNFIQNLSGHQSIINTLAANTDNVLVSGADNGSMQFWDWRSGYCFQKMQAIAQPGSLDSESGIFASTFDMSGCRLITAEADKTIKIFKEDEAATEETHPIEWKAQVLRKRKY
jgi:pleiotropic regulator 1